MLIKLQKMNLCKPGNQNFEGVRPIFFYVLRVYFALMFFVLGYTAWTEIIIYTGEWDLTNAVTFCFWAGYATISLAMVAVPFVPWKYFFFNYTIPTKK